MATKRAEHPNSSAWSPQTLSAWVVTPSGRRDPAWLVRWSSCCLYNWLMGESSHYSSQALSVFLCFLLHTQQWRLPHSSCAAFLVRLWSGWRWGRRIGFQSCSVWHQSFWPYPSTSILYKTPYQTKIDHPSPTHLYTFPLLYPHQQCLGYLLLNLRPTHLLGPRLNRNSS